MLMVLLFFSLLSSFLCAFYLFLPVIFFSFFFPRFFTCCVWVCYVFVVVVVLYRCAWRNVNDVLCKRRFFSLLLILKSEMLGYIVCTSGYQRWPLFFCFFPFLLSNIFFRYTLSLVVMWLRRGHTCCQSTIRWVHKRLRMWIAIWWLTSFFSRLIFLLLSGRCFFLYSSECVCCSSAHNSRDNVSRVCREKKNWIERIKAHTKRT